MDPSADFSESAAQRWLQRHKERHNEAEAARRESLRQECLQSSVLAGASVGVVTSLGSWKLLRTRSASFQRNIGGSGAAFIAFSTFFVPFVYTTNRCRVRCVLLGRTRRAFLSRHSVPFVAGVSVVAVTWDRAILFNSTFMKRARLDFEGANGASFLRSTCLWRQLLPLHVEME